jgi:hypothetical protein
MTSSPRPVTRNSASPRTASNHPTVMVAVSIRTHEYPDSFSQGVPLRCIDDAPDVFHGSRRQTLGSRTHHRGGPRAGTAFRFRLTCPLTALVMKLSHEKGPGREPGALSAVEERFELSEGVTLTRFRGVLLRPLGHSTIVTYRNRSPRNTTIAIQRPLGATLGKATCPLCHSITTPAAPDTQHHCISDRYSRDSGLPKLCSMARDTPKKSS